MSDVTLRLHYNTLFCKNCQLQFQREESAYLNIKNDDDDVNDDAEQFLKLDF